MIDDYTKVKELMRKMEAQLPISVRPTSACLRTMRKQGIQVARDQELHIQRVFYLGDEGGISCDVTPLEHTQARVHVVVSITHLQVDPSHPLAQEIGAYQRERTRKIARSGGSVEPSSFSIRPRQKHKKRRR
ncbi:MAG: hypothetical protein H8D78_14840 [Chloroflexi bacterium]|nr:hypothetical protein [Chloroflexota bacterium]